MSSLLTVPNDDSGILSVIPIAQLFSATTFELQCLTEDSDMLDSSDGRRHSDVRIGEPLDPVLRFSSRSPFQCMDGYSDEGTAGYDTSLSSSCSSGASWTLSNCRPWHSAVSRHLPTVLRYQHPRSPDTLAPRSTWLAHSSWKA